MHVIDCLGIIIGDVSATAVVVSQTTTGNLHTKKCIHRIHNDDCCLYSCDSLHSYNATRHGVRDIKWHTSRNLISLVNWPMMKIWSQHTCKHCCKHLSGMNSSTSKGADEAVGPSSDKREALGDPAAELVCDVSQPATWCCTWLSALGQHCMQRMPCRTQITVARSQAECTINHLGMDGTYGNSQPRHNVVSQNIYNKCWHAGCWSRTTGTCDNTWCGSVSNSDNTSQLEPLAAPVRVTVDHSADVYAMACQLSCENQELVGISHQMLELFDVIMISMTISGRRRGQELMLSCSRSHQWPWLWCQLHGSDVSAVSMQWLLPTWWLLCWTR